MGRAVSTEYPLLKSKEEYMEEFETEARLRELAAQAVDLYKDGLLKLSNNIILDIPIEERREFRVYLQEYLKHYGTPDEL